MSDYGEYNGDTVHDMWVDFTYQEYTSGGNNWYGGRHSSRRSGRNRRSKSITQLISECQSRIDLNKAKITNLLDKIEYARKSVASPVVPPREKAYFQKQLDINYPRRLARYRQDIENDEATLILLLMKREKERNFLTIAGCIIAIMVALFIFWQIYS